MIDIHIRWSHHICELSNKLSSVLYAIRRVKEEVTHEAAKTAYFSYFYSLLSYDIHFWGMATDMCRTFVLQKQALRFICSLEYNSSCRGHFKRENILTLTLLKIYLLIYESIRVSWRSSARLAIKLLVVTTNVYVAKIIAKEIIIFHVWI